MKIFDKSKKAQVTLFVIIGLVLLVVAFIFFAIHTPTSQEEQLLKSVKDVDATIKPVQIYVESCLQSVSLESLKILGEHGGYIDPVGVNSQKAFSYDQANPVDSDGVFFAETNDYFIPYWFHSKSKAESPDLDPVVAMPTIEEMQLDHQNYVKRNLYECINDFKSFSFKEADIKIIDEVPEITILYTENNVVAKAEFITKINLEGQEKTIEAYITTVPIPIKKYYDLASRMTYSEATDQYLEKVTLSLIGRYSRASLDALPPFADHVYSYEPVIWSQQAVKMQLQELLQSYIPVINVFGSKNYFEINTSSLSDTEKKFFDGFTLNPTTILASPNLDISHIYFPQNYYLKISPSDGDLLKPSSEDFSEAFGQIHGQSDPEQFYNFFYDISYPVIVSIQENNLPGGESFTFNFALESNIRFNRLWTDFADGRAPLKWDPSIIEIEVDDSVAEFDYYFEEDYSSTTQISSEINSPEAIKLFYDEDQLLSGNISVSVIDSYTKEAINDVYVSIGLGSFSSKMIGKTSLDTEFNVSYFSGKAPLVMNGYIELRKEGYESVIRQVTTNFEENLNLGLFQMDKIQEINTSIKILDMSSDIIKSKASKDTVFLTLTKITSTLEKPYSKTIIYRENSSSSLVELIPGKYSLEGFFLSEEGIIIPAKCQRTVDFPKNLLLKEENRWIPQEDVIMKPMMWGGIELSNSYPWKLSSEALYKNNSLEFTVLKFPAPNCFDDLDKLSNMDYYSNKYRSQLLPKTIEQISNNENEFDPNINEGV